MDPFLMVLSKPDTAWSVVPPRRSRFVICKRTICTNHLGCRGFAIVCRSLLSYVLMLVWGMAVNLIP